MQGIRKEFQRAALINGMGAPQGKSNMCDITALRKNVSKDEFCIDGRFVYTIKHNPAGAGNARTDAYVDAKRILYSRFE